MPQSIECRRAQYLIGERLPPFGEVQVAGDDGGAALVALGNEVVEHLIVGLAHWLEAEIETLEAERADLTRQRADTPQKIRVAERGEDQKLEPCHPVSGCCST